MDLLRDLIETKTDHVPIMEALRSLDIIGEKHIQDMTDRVVVDRKGAFWVDREDVDTGKELVKPDDEVIFTHGGQNYHGTVKSKARGRDDDMLQVRASKLIRENTRGGKIIPRAIKGAKAFFKSNPSMVVGAAAMAVSAYTQYKRNKRNTITLHAKDAYERRMMTSIVDALTKQNTFRIVRTKFQGGGKSWQLKRVGTSV